MTIWDYRYAQRYMYDHSQCKGWSDYHVTWNAAPIERYKGKTYRETRKIRGKMIRYEAENYPTKRIVNTFMINELVVVPGYVRLDAHTRDDGFLVCENGKAVMVVVECGSGSRFPTLKPGDTYFGNDCVGLTLPNGKQVTVMIVWERGYIGIVWPSRFFRYYETPTKDLDKGFDDSRNIRNPEAWKEEARFKAQEIWTNYGGSRMAYHKGRMKIELELYRIFGSNKSAEHSRRQLRALGFVA